MSYPPIIIPERRHHRLAAQIAAQAALGDHVEVMEAIDDMHAADLPIVAALLARLAVTGTTTNGSRRLPYDSVYTTTEAREAHRRYAHGERTGWVVAGERAYGRERKRAERAMKAGR